MAEYDGNVALVYPAALDFKEAHVTIIFLGTISEHLAGRSASEIVNALQTVPELDQYLGVRTTEQVFFGENEDIPVMLVENPFLHHNRSVVEELLFDIGVENASSFTEYKPHITLPDEDYKLPNVVVLGPPVLWWGDDWFNIYTN